MLAIMPGAWCYLLGCHQKMLQSVCLEDIFVIAKFFFVDGNGLVFFYYFERGVWVVFYFLLCQYCFSLVEFQFSLFALRGVFY